MLAPGGAASESLEREGAMFKNANVTIMVADLERAVRFYRDTLGLELAFRAGDEWAQLAAPGLTIGLHPTDERRAAGPRELVSLGFGVEHLESAMAALQRKGVQFKGEITEDPGIRLAHFADPDGTPLYLAQMVWGGGPEGWN
jgi:catechol 2,3-dioxygenase-like lactoylglutathione lyase family enzyme